MSVRHNTKRGETLNVTLILPGVQIRLWSPKSDGQPFVVFTTLKINEGGEGSIKLFSGRNLAICFLDGSRLSACEGITPNTVYILKAKISTLSRSNAIDKSTCQACDK